MTPIPTDMLIVAAVAAALAGVFFAMVFVMMLDRFTERRLSDYPGGRKAFRRDWLVANAAVIVVFASQAAFYLLAGYLPLIAKVGWGVAAAILLAASFIFPMTRKAQLRVGAVFRKEQGR